MHTFSEHRDQGEQLTSKNAETAHGNMKAAWKPWGVGIGTDDIQHLVTD
jgi:hypothetical protein